MMSRHRGRRDVGLDRAAHRERSRRAPQVEARVDPVRVAALLAQQPVQAGVEQAAEDRVHERERVEVRDVPREADMADADLRLGRARPVDDEDPHARLVSGVRCDASGPRPPYRTATRRRPR